METERCDHPCPPFAIACIAVAKVQGSIHAVRHTVAALLAGWRASSTSTAQLHVLKDPLTYIRGMPSVVLVFVAAMEESPPELKTALLLLPPLLLMLTGLARSSITPSFGSGIN